MPCESWIAKGEDLTQRMMLEWQGLSMRCGVSLNIVYLALRPYMNECVGYRKHKAWSICEYWLPFA